MRIAGVYASAFLLSLPNILFFFIFKLLCVYKDGKQCDSAPPPKYAIRDTPVKDSEHLINHLHLSNDINI